MEKETRKDKRMKKTGLRMSQRKRKRKTRMKKREVGKDETLN